MPTITTNDIKNGMALDIEGVLFEIVEFQHVKPGKGGAFVRTTLKNARNGAVVERTFRAGEKVERAMIDKREMQFLYRSGDEYVFMDNATYDQYELTKEQVDDSWKWIKEGTVCSMLLYNGNPISMEPPNHMVLKVEYAEPAMRGNTATNLTKPVKLETGAEILVPAFIEQGETVKVDTRTGEYLERVKA